MAQEGWSLNPPPTATSPYQDGGIRWGPISWPLVTVPAALGFDTTQCMHYVHYMHYTVPYFMRVSKFKKCFMLTLDNGILAQHQTPKRHSSCARHLIEPTLNITSLSHQNGTFLHE